MRIKRIVFILACTLVSTLLRAQTGNEGVEAPTSENAAHYPSEWAPGPERTSLPEWATPGRIRFARWDGGPLETAKYILSGYPGFNPPIPDYIYALANWYDPRTVSLLREANVNLIWVTFSNGFSDQTERPQQELARRYIEECHRQGIHVMAYESIANMFWEDMYEHMPESRDWVRLGKDGKPVPYGSGNYTKMGRVTRYMADVSNPGWRELLRRRIDLAIDAGADGVMYDNNFGGHLDEIYQDIYRYATTRKSDFLLMGNFHRNTYVLNRLVNIFTTEDGIEPGVWEDTSNPAIGQDLPVTGREWVPGKQYRAVPNQLRPLRRLEADDGGERAAGEGRTIHGANVGYPLPVVTGGEHDVWSRFRIVRKRDLWPRPVSRGARSHVDLAGHRSLQPVLCRQRGILCGCAFRRVTRRDSRQQQPRRRIAEWPRQPQRDIRRNLRAGCHTRKAKALCCGRLADGGNGS